MLCKGLGILLLFNALGWLVDRCNPLRCCILTWVGCLQHDGCCQRRCSEGGPMQFKLGLVKALRGPQSLTAHHCKCSTRSLHAHCSRNRISIQVPIPMSRGVSSPTRPCNPAPTWAAAQGGVPDRGAQCPAEPTA